ncbi:MAG: serine hydrolase [Bacteroidota bacterium]
MKKSTYLSRVCLTIVVLYISIIGRLIGQNSVDSSTPWKEDLTAVPALQEAVDFALNHEYSGSRDLRQAIYKGFQREPYHEIKGKTKKRGGPAGMIIHRGQLLAAWGNTKRVDMTFSVTKSYLSTVAGLAIDHGLIKSVDDAVADYVWDGTFDGEHNRSITWRHLLTQSSDWTGQLWGGYDWADRPEREGGIDDWKLRELHPPGTNFEYNDVRVNVLAYALLQVWRRPLPEVIKDHIMDPIKASTTWRWYGYEDSWTDIDGQMMQSVSGGGHSGGGLFISTEDHAKFGMLFLNNGSWEDRQLISPKWIKDACTPSAANRSYGYMWWLNPDGDNQNRMSNLSPTGYYAAGFGGNYIIIEPEDDLLIVTRWLEPSSANEFLGIVKEVLTK